MNVAGYVNMTIPMVAGVMVPSGLLRIDVHGVCVLFQNFSEIILDFSSVSNIQMVLEVEISVERGSHGPKIGVTSCANFIDKVDISIEGDGNNRHAFLKVRSMRILIADDCAKMMIGVSEIRIQSHPGRASQSNLSNGAGDCESAGIYLPSYGRSMLDISCGIDTNHRSSQDSHRSLKSSRSRKLAQLLDLDLFQPLPCRIPSS